MVLFQCNIKEQGKGEDPPDELCTLKAIQYKPTSLYQKGMKVLVSYDGLDWKRTYMVGQVLTSHNILWILFMISKSLGSKYSLLMDFRILTLFILLVISIPYLMNSSSKSKLIVIQNFSSIRHLQFHSWQSSLYALHL